MIFKTIKQLTMTQNRMMYLLVLIPLITTVSCKKFLDKKSDTTLVVPKSISDIQGILDDNFFMNSQTPGFGETSSDDYFVPMAIYNSLPKINQEAYTWRLENYSYSNDWSTCYIPVYNSNYCLEKVEKIIKSPQNESSWNNIKGSALFFRAFYFLNLVWEYGKAYDDNTSSTDLGIVLRLTSDFNIPSVRSSVKECYERIIQDLNEAVLYLPEHPLNVMRPSKPAGYALLARAYLTMRKYDSAFKYADLFIQRQNRLLDYNSAEVNINSNIPFQPFNEEIVFYSTQSFFYSPKTPSRARIDTILYAEFNDNDIRKTAFFKSDNGYYRFKGNYSSAQSLFFTGIAVDEIYLIRAECNARLGKLDEALNDLNALLIKRFKEGTFIMVTANSSSEALDIILKERRKELLMRGLRWIDIKRLNLEGAGIIPKRLIGSTTFQLQVNDRKYALPLPMDIINITGMPQN